MKFHVFSPIEWPPDPVQDAPPGRDSSADLERLVLAEAQGYDGAWIAEHPASEYGIGPSVHLAAAWLSARTSRIRIGTAVTLLPSFHPLRLAEEIAMLDIMSGGRFDWAIGCGPADSTLPNGDRHRVFREQLEILERAWTGESFSYDGDFFQIPELRCLPTPVQKPRPPIWIAAGTTDTVEWAAANQRPLLVDALSSILDVAETHRRYREASASAGHDTTHFELPMLCHVHVGETTAQAREEAGPTPDSAIVGDAAHCREKICELRERLGLDSLICWHDFDGLSQETSNASQQRFADDVAPAFA